MFSGCVITGVTEVRDAAAKLVQIDIRARLSDDTTTETYDFDFGIAGAELTALKALPKAQWKATIWAMMKPTAKSLYTSWLGSLTKPVLTSTPVAVDNEIKGNLGNLD